MQMYFKMRRDSFRKKGEQINLSGYDGRGSSHGVNKGIPVEDKTNRISTANKDSQTLIIKIYFIFDTHNKEILILLIKLFL